MKRKQEEGQQQEEFKKLKQEEGENEVAVEKQEVQELKVPDPSSKRLVQIAQLKKLKLVLDKVKDRGTDITSITTKMVYLLHNLYGSHSSIYQDVAKRYEQLNTDVGRYISQSFLESYHKIRNDALSEVLVFTRFFKIAKIKFASSINSAREFENKKLAVPDKIMLDLFIYAIRIAESNSEAQCKFLHVKNELLDLFPKQKIKFEKFYDAMSCQNSLMNAIVLKERNKIEEELKIATKDVINSVNSHFVTPLMMSLFFIENREDKESLVKILLPQMDQAYIDVIALIGNNAAYIALSDKDENIAQIVVQAVSIETIFAITPSGVNALSMAIGCGHFNCVELILEKYNELPDEKRKALWHHIDPFPFFKSLVSKTFDKKIKLDIVQTILKDLCDMKDAFGPYANSLQYYVTYEDAVKLSFMFKAQENGEIIENYTRNSDAGMETLGDNNDQDDSSE